MRVMVLQKFKKIIMEIEEFNKLDKINRGFLDTIDFKPYLDKYEEIHELREAFENDYDNSNQLPEELQGCVLDTLDTYDFIEYLKTRYNLNIREETITHYYIIK